MKINYVSKKFYGQYVYKLVLNIVASKITSRYFGPAPELLALPHWLANNNHTDHKIRNRFQSSNGSSAVYNQIVYVSDSDLKDALIKQFAGNITEVWQPLNKEHEQALEVRNVFEPRQDLLFKKYKYAVYFKYNRRGQVFEWLNDLFGSNENAKLTGSSYWPRLYLSDDCDITMIKLSWPDSVSYIKTVLLINPDD